MKEEAGQFLCYPEQWFKLPHGKELFFYVIGRNAKEPEYRWDVFKGGARTDHITDVDKWSLFEGAEPFQGNLSEAKKKIMRVLI